MTANWHLLKIVLKDKCSLLLQNISVGPPESRYPIQLVIKQNLVKGISERKVWIMALVCKCICTLSSKESCSSKKSCTCLQCPVRERERMKGEQDRTTSNKCPLKSQDTKCCYRSQIWSSGDCVQQWLKTERWRDFSRISHPNKWIFLIRKNWWSAVLEKSIIIRCRCNLGGGINGLTSWCGPALTEKLSTFIIQFWCQYTSNACIP